MNKETENCIFCKIIANQISSTCVYEDKHMKIIKDINPIAPIHLVAIVKLHYARLEKTDQEQAKNLGLCLAKIANMQTELGLTNGYRLIINQGKDGGQTVEHVHIHILAGKELNWVA